MNHMHKIIKIMYSEMGFLPDHPYHLISDKEMFDAFLGENGFFATYYPCPDDKFREAYDALLNYITDCINKFQSDEDEEIPAWVYSYMIMRPITYASPEEDIDYLCEMANIDVSAGSLAEFTTDVAETCYEISTRWLQKMPSADRRPPTMFGETHVTKSLRLTQANILLDSEIGVNN